MLITVKIKIIFQEKENKNNGTIWDDVVTPINIKFDTNPTTPSMYKRSQNNERIKKKLFGIECSLNSLGELNMEKMEEQEEQLMRMQKDYTEAEAELRRFQQEELELVKAGEDPLLTCPLG